MVPHVHVCFQDQAARFVYLHISAGDQSSAKRPKFIGKSIEKTTGGEGLTGSGAIMESAAEEEDVTAA